MYATAHGEFGASCNIPLGAGDSVTDSSRSEDVTV
jgi:hypothetical protein